jgi:hypothetical protein
MVMLQEEEDSLEISVHVGNTDALAFDRLFCLGFTVVV